MKRSVLALFCLLVAALLVLQISERSGQRLLEGTATSDLSSSGESPISATTGQTASGSGAFPALTGRVVDLAGLLPPEAESELTSRLAAFEEKSSDQVVVATIPSLGGNNLERYANDLFRHWELGQAQENNGILLLIARDDRKIRIEVGYGLEGSLTDALARTIIDQVIVPRFKAGDFPGGISEGANMIIAVLSGDTAELEARKKRNPSNVKQQIDIGLWIFIIIWGILFFGPLGFAVLAPIFGTKLGKNRYRWLGMEVDTTPRRRSSRGSSSGSWSSGGWSGGSSGGGFSGGGGSSGGGGASGGW